MPQTQVVFYQDEDGSVPILEWFELLPDKALDKCRVKLERLRDLGHEHAKVVVTISGGFQLFQRFVCIPRGIVRGRKLQREADQGAMLPIAGVRRQRS